MKYQAYESNPCKKYALFKNKFENKNFTKTALPALKYHNYEEERRH